MRIRTGALAIIVFVAFGIGIGSTRLTNLWHTESRKIPSTFTEGKSAGLADPSDIRGSYSFGDIEKAFGVPAEDLAAAFGVTKDPNTFQCKDLHALYVNQEFGDTGTDAVRFFVARYLDLPYQPGEETILPEPAIEILGDRIDDETVERMRRLR